MQATLHSWKKQVSERNRILDLGSGAHGSSMLINPDKLVRIDIQAQLRPDVVANTELLPFKDGSFDGVLAMSILEHVPRPWVAVGEIYRVLKTGGIILGYVPYMYPYHADSSFHDYYRFSDEGLRFLFSGFRSITLVESGGYTNALLRFVAGFTASERHLLRVEPLVSSFLAGIARATGILDSTRVQGLRRSPTGTHFLAQK